MYSGSARQRTASPAACRAVTAGASTYPPAALAAAGCDERLQSASACVNMTASGRVQMKAVGGDRRGVSTSADARGAFALAAALAGCGESPTRLVARVDSDLAPGTELRAVEVEARWEGGGLLGMRRFDLAGESLRLPGQVVLEPRDPADARRVIVTVTGAVQPPTGAGYTLRQEFVTRFERGRTLVVRYALVRVA